MTQRASVSRDGRKNPIRVEESTTGDYQDMSAVCQDKHDGDISNHLEIKGTVINMANPGTYRVTYTCKNSRGVAASAKHRIVMPWLTISALSFCLRSIWRIMLSRKLLTRS